LDKVSSKKLKINKFWEDISNK